MADLLKRTRCILLFAILLVFPSPGVAQWKPVKTIESVPFTSICITDSSLLRADDSLMILPSGDSVWKTVHIGQQSHGFSNMLAVGRMIYGSNFESVFVSDDYGRTWQRDTVGLPALPYTYPGRFTNDADTVYYCIGHTIYRTLDSGQHWLFVDSSFVNTVELYYCSHDTLFADCDEFIYKSTNGGTSWKKQLGTTSFHTIVLGNAWFALSDLDGLVTKSTNEGRSWVTLHAGLPGGQVEMTAIKASGSRLVVASDSGLYISDNLGLNWIKTTKTFLITPFFRSLSVNGERIFVGTGSNTGEGFGAYLSTDRGTTLSPVASNGLPISVAFSKIIAYHDTLFALNGYSGLYYSLDQGETWFNSPQPSGTQLVDIAVDDDHIYAMGFDHGPLVFDKHSGQWENSYAISSFSDDPKHINATTSGVFAFESTTSLVSNDYGKTWNPLNLNLPIDSIQNIVQIGSQLYATFYNGPYRSDDGGKTWRAINVGLPPSIVSVTGVPGALYVVAEGRVFFSSDNGVHWAADPGNAGAEIAVNERVVLSGGYFYLKGSAVVLQALGASNWKDESIGFDSTSNGILSLALTSQYAIASTSSNIYRRPLAEMGAVSGVSKMQNKSPSIRSYPNPASHSTTITFSSANRCVAQVTIANLLGQEVATLFNGELEAGDHSFSWDAGNAISGAYVCVVKVGDKMMRSPIVVAK
jgi:photosystem II stability/assembly factor-like uncharacterized protein